MPAPLGFLRSLIRHEGPIDVRAAGEADLPAIAELMRRSSHAYSGYGGAMHESLHSDISLIAWQQQQLAGYIMVHRQGPAAAWVYALGAAADASLASVGQTLLQDIERLALQEGIAWLAYMDEYDLGWLRRLLEANGFRRHTRVVGYEAPAHTPPALGNAAVWVRPATAADIPAIAQLDEAAFGPLWAYNERVLLSVLGQAGCFELAELDGQPIGYVLGTIHQGARAHIVRLAVHPRGQGQGIGVRLLAEAFVFFRSEGVQWIGLNTQEENLRSQRLYHWFGFRPTGDTTGVWAKNLTGDEGPWSNDRVVR